MGEDDTEIMKDRLFPEDEMVKNLKALTKIKFSKSENNFSLLVTLTIQVKWVISR